jgi:hypothetical protein
MSEFSKHRAQAIELMNRGVEATCGANGVPPNPTLGYQLIASSVDIDPTFAHGWFALGNAHSDLKLKAAAVAAYRRALQLPEGTEIGDLTADFKAKTLCNIGHTLFHMGRHDESMQRTMESLALDEARAFTWANKSLVHSVRGEDQESVAAAQKALALEPTNPTVEVALAFALLHLKQYERGLRHFEARFPYMLKQFMNYPYPKWQGEENSELFLVADQGLGDTIDFMRFVPRAQMRCKHIWLGAQPEMMRVFHAMFGHHKNMSFIPLPQPFPPATHWVALMSLPTALGLSDRQIIETPMPPVEVIKHIPEWKVRGKKLHVGVAWGGARLNDVDHWRSVAVDQFLDLSTVSHVQFYSLQVGERGPEMHAVGAGPLLKDITPYIRDVMDTLSIMQHLDLIICVDTGLGHMAGLLNIPCWIPVSFNGCCWRFSRHGDKALWYPKHRLYRQGEDCDWKPVFERIAGDLDHLANREERRAAA